MLAASVPVPAFAEDEACATAGQDQRYLLVFPQGTAPDAANRQVTAACGATTVFYPQISVGVATAADPGFAGRFGADRVFAARPGHRSARAKLPESDPGDVSSADRTGEQWDMAAIGAPGAGSPDVVVGVLDSGIEADHPELSRAIDRDDSAGCLTGKPDQDENAWLPTTSAHGTHVAGIVAAADDGRGVTGVAPGVRVASVKVIDDSGYVAPEAAVCGLMWAAQRHMAVANSSFVVDPWGLACSHGPGQDVVREAISRAVEYSTTAGTLDVAAASNESVNLTPSSHASASGCEALPAGLRDVVTVSAVGQDDVKAGYSSYGLGVVDLAAPGGSGEDCVLSTVPGGYGRMCGTSMAAPHVAGVAAAVASEHPGLGPEGLRDALNAGTRAIPCPADYDPNGDGQQDGFCAGYTGYNGFYGHGLVDLPGALAAAG
nr:S8 family serine peptidase [Amycolatopsis acidicola]